MLCKVCKDGLEGMWNSSRTNGLGLKKEFLGKDESQSPSDDEDKQSQTERSEIEKYIYGHHENKYSFLQSQLQGCVMCNRFRLYDKESNPRIEKLGYFSIFYVWLRDDKLFMSVHHGDSQGGFELVPFGDPKFDDHLNFELSPSTHDSKTWVMIQKWFTTCVESHDQCRKPQTSASYMPTRVLELDSSQEPFSFSLIEGTQCPPGSSYLTLSHCWGDKPVETALRLLRSTINELERKQSITVLPKTFRDAIEIAERFGISYLWIDRLCIFQDSPEDWRRESSSMQEVYRNAVLNISALGATDDDDGCFFNRDPSQIAPTVVHLRFAEQEKPKAYRFELEKGWAWRLSFEREPLVQRAWVVQERLLAQRVVHFGRKQVFWECKEARCCETHPDDVYVFDDEDIMQRRKREDNSHLWKQLLDAADRRHATNAYEQLFTDWNAIVELYADCDLTVASDKLVALSGLANDMRNRLQELKPGPHRYLAGLWEEKLLKTLTWNVRGPAERASTYRAPSWSWASLDGRLNTLVLQTPENTRTFASLISAETELSGTTDTGEVKNGSIALAGPWAMLRVRLESAGASYYPNQAPVDMLRYSEHEATVELTDSEWGKERGISHQEVLFDTLDDMRSELFQLVVKIGLWYDKKWFGSGLALTCVEGNKYKRVGVVSYHFDSKEEAEVFIGKFPRKQITIV